MYQSTMLKAFLAYLDVRNRCFQAHINRAFYFLIIQHVCYWYTWNTNCFFGYINLIRIVVVNRFSKGANKTLNFCNVVYSQPINHYWRPIFLDHFQKLFIFIFYNNGFEATINVLKTNWRHMAQFLENIQPLLWKHEILQFIFNWLTPNIITQSRCNAVFHV